MKDDSVSRAAVLNLIEQSCCDLEYDCDNVALRKEVEALPSAQPTGTKTVQVDDCISRQAAVKTVKKHYRGFDNDLLEVIAYEMERLPSAQQPEQFNPCTVCQEFDCTGCKFRRTI